MAIPSFPGAYGFGSKATGGRNHLAKHLPYIVTVYDHTPNKNADDIHQPGTFRWAVHQAKQDGGGTILFTTGGYITVGEKIDLGSNLTIAGQTAAGEGVVFRKKKNKSGPIMRISHGTNNVVMRYIKLRPGQKLKPGVGKESAILVTKQAYNVIFDHLSIEWTTDEGGDLWTEDPKRPVYDVTYQNTIFAANLEPHSAGIIVGGSHHVWNVTLFRNYFAHNSHRNPWLASTHNTQFVNNIVYNWKTKAGSIIKARGGFHSPQVDLVGNHFRSGPWNSNPNAPPLRYWSWRKNGEKHTDLYPLIYIVGNKAEPFLKNSASDNWPLLAFHDSNACKGNYDLSNRPTTKCNFEKKSNLSSLPKSGTPGTARNYRANRPTSDLDMLPIVGADQARALVFAEVGDSRRLTQHGELVPRRDALDKRFITDFNQRTGPNHDSRNDHEDDYKGYKSIRQGVAYRDSDKDGLPNAYENNPVLRIKCGSCDQDEDGYKNLEEFLNGTVPTKAPLIQWDFENGSGTKVSDVSPLFAKPGRLKNMSTNQWQTKHKKNGKYSIKLQGGDDYIEAEPIPFYHDFSVSLWIRFQSMSSSRIFDNRSETGSKQGFSIRSKPTGHVEAIIDFGPNSKTIRTSKPLKTNAWYHIATVIDREGFQRLYVNGKEAATPVRIGAYAGRNIVQEDKVIVGAQNSAPFSGHLHAWLDGVRVYDRAISAAEIRKLQSK